MLRVKRSPYSNALSERQFHATFDGLFCEWLFLQVANEGTPLQFHLLQRIFLRNWFSNYGLALSPLDFFKSALLVTDSSTFANSTDRRTDKSNFFQTVIVSNVSLAVISQSRDIAHSRVYIASVGICFQQSTEFFFFFFAVLAASDNSIQRLANTRWRRDSSFVALEDNLK